MPRLTHLFSTAAAALLLALPAWAEVGAAAQESHPSGVYSTSSDVAMMKAIAPRLYKRDDAVKGASEAWHNPTTGHRGTITVLDVFDRDSAPCRKVRYHTVYDVTNATTYVLDWCRTAPGEWKIR